MREGKGKEPGGGKKNRRRLIDQVEWRMTKV